MALIHYYKYKDMLSSKAETTVMGVLVTCPHCKDLMTQDELQEHERKEDTIKLFFMVLVEGTTNTKHRHDTYDEAQVEAERLIQQAIKEQPKRIGYTRPPFCIMNV